MERNYFYACYGSDIFGRPDHCDFDHMFKVLEYQKDPFCGLELNIYTKLVRPDHDIKIMEYKNELKKYKVSFHAPHWETEATADLDSEQGRINLNAYAEALELCDVLDVKSMVMHTHQRKVECEAAKPALKENVVKTIFRFNDMCREHGVQLLVENVGFYKYGSMLYDEEQYIRLFDSLPADVGSLIDIGHAILNGWDIDHVISTLGTRIKAYHIHNNPGDKDSHNGLFEPGMAYTLEMVEHMFMTMEKYTPQANMIFEYGPAAKVTPESMHEDFARIDKLRCSYYNK